MKLITKMPDDANKFVKQPIPIRAKRIPEAFAVGSKEGVVQGQPGDMLMEGIEGELYICAYEIFQKSYTPFFDEGSEGDFPNAEEN